MGHVDEFLSEARTPAAREGTSGSSWQTIWHKFTAKLASHTTNFPFGTKIVFSLPDLQVPGS